MIVMKFGGTSTQDATAIENVSRIVQTRIKQQPILVISAIAQATNMLEQAGKFAADGKEQEAHDILEKLFTRHRTIVYTIIKNNCLRVELQNVLDSSLVEIKAIVRGVAILRELTPRTLDTFYSYGELLSSRLVAAALLEHGVATEWLDTKDFMITDDNFNRAQPMMDVVEEKIQPIVMSLIEKNIVPVTQGFIGITASGCRTTMGRESSDFSASIIGSVLNVDDIQIWTDVDGVLTADPRIVAAPKKVKVLSFDEAYELSYFGAKVLHPNTMLPAIEKRIPIHIFNSRRSNLSGTLITTEANSDETIVKSVAYKRNVVVINITPNRRYSQYIFWEHIYNILTKYDALASMTTTSEYNYSLVLEVNKNISAIVHEFKEIGKVQMLERMGIICLVGANLRQASKIFNRIFSAIADMKIAMISFGASSNNLSFVVADEIVPEAVRKIHAEFFERSMDTNLFEVLEHFQSQQDK